MDGLVTSKTISYLIHDRCDEGWEMAFLNVWLSFIVGCTILASLRHLVDRNDRREVSIF